MSNVETVIYFIRHAQSFQTVKLSHSEWPLSELGKKQAKSLALLLQNLKIEKVISSPIIRCRETVRPFIETSNVELEINDDLRERHVVDSVVDNFYEIWQRSWSDFDFAVTGCESSRQAQSRFVTAVKEIAQVHKGATLGISTHGNVLGLFFNFLDSAFNIKEAEKIRNPDVLRVVANDGGFEWDQEFSLPDLNQIATDHSSTPNDLRMRTHSRKSNRMKESLHFRQLNLNDEKEVYEIARIHEDAPKNWIANYIINSKNIEQRIEQIRTHNVDVDHFYLVAKTTDATIVGFHWIDLEEVKNEKCGHIKSLWVHDDWQRQGIASELKRRGEEWARSKGANYIKTSVHYQNKRMLDFNLCHGFKPGFVELTKDL
jgi:2,3-bisphosphoglycerate-dependent phosphoglycerate mutase